MAIQRSTLTAIWHMGTTGALALVSVSEAADRLGISVQRVHPLLQSGALAGQHPGHEWLIDEADLSRSRHQQPGRPLSPTSAWALALLAYDEDLARDLLFPSDRSRAKPRLRELVRLRNEIVHRVGDHSVEELAGYLSQLFRNRAERRLYRASNRDLDDLRTDRRVRLAGVSLSASEISAGDMVEAYVDEREVDALVDDYLLDHASPRQSNVVLHVLLTRSYVCARRVIHGL